MATGSTTAVYSAIIGNSIVMCAKFIAFFATGSSSMLSEGIHSFADVSNQALLAVGIKRSGKKADKRHPYGYVRERYIWALVSAVGIFFLGCGVTIYHGIHTLIEPRELDDLTLAFWVLAFAFVVEGATLILAIVAVNNEAVKSKQSFMEYIRQGSDPTGIAVVLEDGVAVIGVLVAAAGLYLTHVTKNSTWDAIATLIIGSLLGLVAIYLTYRTKALLVGQAIPLVSRRRIVQILKGDPIVDRIYDIKTAIMGVDDQRFKAEVEFDGAKVAEKALDRQELHDFFEKVTTQEALQTFLIDYGDSVIETLGDEIDRIEDLIKKELPQLKHIDIEVN